MPFRGDGAACIPAAAGAGGTSAVSTATTAAAASSLLIPDRIIGLLSSPTVRTRRGQLAVGLATELVLIRRRLGSVLVSGWPRSSKVREAGFETSKVIADHFVPPLGVSGPESSYRGARAAV